jgi:hypothetical protein
MDENKNKKNKNELELHDFFHSLNVCKKSRRPACIQGVQQTWAQNTGPDGEWA